MTSAATPSAKGGSGDPAEGRAEAVLQERRTVIESMVNERPIEDLLILEELHS